MTAPDTPAVRVLARSAAVAAERRLVEVSAFVETLPDEQERGLLLLESADVDSGALVGWIAAQDPQTPIRVRPLDAGSDPAVTLGANRVLAAVRCGVPLEPGTVAALAAVAERPRQSFKVVLVGAEVVTTAEDLDLVRRGLWRVLFAEPWVPWTGQDLDGHGCLLWTDQSLAGAASTVTDSVTGDVRRLRRWLRSPVARVDDLDRMRAAHAVDLLATGLASTAATTQATTAGTTKVTQVRPHRRGTDGRAVRAASVAIADIRGRLLGRLDADLNAIRLQIDATLQTLEVELLAGVKSRVERLAPADLRGEALSRAVSSYLTEGTAKWREDTARLIRNRLDRTAAQAEDLIDGVDWELVNSVLDAPPGARYPTVIIDQLTPRTAALYPEPATMRAAHAPGRRAEPVPPVVRRVVYGGLLAAVSVAIIGPVLPVAVAAGAIGAAGGVEAESLVTTLRARGASVGRAKAAVTAAMDEFTRSVHTAFREVTGPIRHAVETAFAELENALEQVPIAAPGGLAGDSADVIAAPGRPASGPVDADAALLAELRTQLARCTERN